MVRAVFILKRRCIAGYEPERKGEKHPGFSRTKVIDFIIKSNCAIYKSLKTPPLENAKTILKFFYCSDIIDWICFRLNSLIDGD